jgi:pimeloyl-ACP methyl ester carboxylesterase
VYLRRYQDRVRAIVLASGVPMSEVLPDNLGASAKRAYQLLADDCATDAPCHAAFPNFRAELQSLRQSLSVDQLLGLHLLMYSSASARRLPWLVREAARGRPQLLEQEIGHVRESLAGQLTVGLHLSVVCSEDLPFSRHPPPADPVGSAFDSQYVALCRDWPRGEVPADFRAPFHSDVPVLIISGDRDPVTPPEDAAAIAGSFGHAKVVTVPGSSHLLDGFDGCLNGIVSRFLDGLSSQTGCVDSIRPAPFYLGR